MLLNNINICGVLSALKTVKPVVVYALVDSNKDCIKENPDSIIEPGFYSIKI